jgi:hypothetical protein
VRGGETPKPVQELAGSGFPQAENPEENFHLQGGKAFPISILERDDAARSAHRSVDMPSHKFRRGPKGDNAVVRGRGEGGPRKGGTHVGHLASGRHRDPRGTSMEPPARASAIVARGRRQCEKAAGRAAERGPMGVQASCQIEMERPSPGTASLKYCSTIPCESMKFQIF